MFEQASIEILPGKSEPNPIRRRGGWFSRSDVGC